MKKKKKRKVKIGKLLSRLIFLILLIVLAINILKSIVGGGKKENLSDITIIVDNNDVTSSLVNEPYIAKDNILYLSIEDVRNIFDKNIFYESQTDKILTTSQTKTAAISVNDNTFQLNSANLTLTNKIMEYGKTYYIPISEISNVYNIELFVNEKSAVIASLYKEANSVKTLKKVSLKEKTGAFSKTIKKIEEGTELIYVEDVDSKWVKVITYEGDIRIYWEEKSFWKN